MMDTSVDDVDDSIIINRDIFCDIEVNQVFEEEGVIATEKELLFLNEGCKCRRNCTGKFGRQEILSTRLCCQEMKYYCNEHISHHHIHLKSAMNVVVHTGASTMPAGYNKPSDRKNIFTQYLFRGIIVCQQFFEFVNACSSKELRNVRSQFLDNGVSESVHGNSKRIAVNKQVSIEVWNNAVKFIRSYGMQHGLVLPGRIPAFREYDDLFVLPSSVTKSSLYDSYKAACEEANLEYLRISIWYYIWRTLCHNVVILKPRSDLCTVCKNSMISISKLHNLPEYEKKQQIEKSLNHLKVVEEERNYYKSLSVDCKNMLEKTSQKVTQGESLHRELRYKGDMHYSFDYAQQIFIPHDSQQVGPIYFLAPYKVSLFGIAIEPVNMFVLYVIPESCSIGKGANSVVSFVHHCLENFSFGETNLYLHADNCCGQNKNRFMLQYCVWRTVVGLNESVQISFLPVGHTKFQPDAHFGNFKRRWIKSSANCLKDVCRIAVKQKGTNVVLVGDENQNGIPYVKQYDWSTFFKEKDYQTVPKIRKALHFNSDQYEVGVMRSRSGLQAESVPHVIIPDDSNVDGFPLESFPTPISEARRNYLYKTIRPFVKTSCKDILCPKP